MSSQERKSYIYPSGRRLFRKRLFSHWREQWKILATVVDWTVWLYLLIPGLLLGGRLYFEFWTDALPAWSTALPFVFIPILLVLLINKGGLLLLVQEGDMLFLRQRPKWIGAVMLRGLLYSLAVTALKLCAGFALLLPFMVRRYGMSGEAVLALLALTLVCGWCVTLAVHLVKVQQQGWRRWLWRILAMAVPCGLYVRFTMFWSETPALLLATGGLFAAAAVYLLRKRLRLQGTFINDVREDNKHRMRLAALILSRVLDKPRPTRHKPWIFRKSQPLLKSKQPESRFAATAIKAMVRNPAHLKLYLSFAGVSAVAILIVPSFLKWLLFVVFICLMAYWLFSFWTLFAGDDYIGILPFTKAQKAAAGSRAVPALLIPFAVFLSAVASLQLYAWWGLILFIPVGAAAGLLIARVFGFFKLEQ